MAISEGGQEKRYLEALVPDRGVCISAQDKEVMEQFLRGERVDPATFSGAYTRLYGDPSTVVPPKGVVPMEDLRPVDPDSARATAPIRPAKDIDDLARTIVPIRGCLGHCVRDDFPAVSVAIPNDLDTKPFPKKLSGRAKNVPVDVVSGQITDINTLSRK